MMKRWYQRITFKGWMWWIGTLQLLITGLRFLLTNDFIILAEGSSCSAIIFMVGWLISNWIDDKKKEKIIKL